jgi:DNA-binding PadR family transcriptional regulator
VRDRTRRHHHEDDAPFRHEYGRHPHRERGGRARGRSGRPRDRARRGEARYLLLDALRDGPKHGYEIIRALEERSSGKYAPSPGTVYPTLQYLEDLGLVRAEQEAERRVYHLTETGRAELNAHAEEVGAFWTRLRGPGASPASQTELGFLQDELDHLTRTVWGGLRTLLDRDDYEAIRRVRQSVEQCRDAVRRIIAGDTPEAM